MNTAGLAMLEANSLDQVKGLCVYPLVAEENREAFMALTRDVFKGRSGTLEFKMTGMKGRPLWLYTHAVPLRNEAGEIVSALAVTTDITRQKLVEEALRESEVRFRRIFEDSPIGMAVTTPDLRFQQVNSRFCEILGYTERELTGMTFKDITHPDDAGASVLNVQRLLAGESDHFQQEKRYIRKDGTTVWARLSLRLLRDGDGRPLCFLPLVEDITERLLLEEERLKTQKLESVGVLAGGIAHDFNNLLQGIFGYISMARMTIDRKEKSLAMLDQAEKALHHSVNLTTQLLTFSKGGKPVKRRISLPPVIENAVKFALSGSRTDYSLDIKERLLAVEADEGQIAQVIQNIVLNAEQAMPMGGTVVITAGNVHAPGPGVPVPLKEGDYVMISIRDSGVGIPEQYLTRIFDPYFTTKEKGSGLGLATSYSVIRNHGGMIDVRSEVGKGSDFTIYLPAAAGGAQPAAARPAAAQPLRRGRILVMDDDDVVRTVAGELLRLLDQEVEFSEDGETAIIMYQAANGSGRPYDVVILDLTIRGGMGGVETVRKLREIDPEVKAVVSSGYSDDDAVSEYRKYGFQAFLKKPYDLDELRNILNAIMK